MTAPAAPDPNRLPLQWERLDPLRIAAPAQTDPPPDRGTPPMPRYEIGYSADRGRWEAVRHDARLTVIVAQTDTVAAAQESCAQDWQWYAVKRRGGYRSRRHAPPGQQAVAAALAELAALNLPLHGGRA